MVFNQVQIELTRLSAFIKLVAIDTCRYIKVLGRNRILENQQEYPAMYKKAILCHVP